MKKYLILLLAIPNFGFSQGDNCSSAVSLNGVLGSVNCSTNSYNITSFTSSADQSFSCAGGGGIDGWFTLTVPNSGKVNIETSTASAGSMTDSDLQVFTGACGSLTSVACTDGGSNISGSGSFDAGLFLTGLTPGQTIYINIWDYYGTASDFDLCVYDPEPINDAPCTSRSLSVDCAKSFNLGSNAGMSNSSVPDPGCGNYAGEDLWFSFVAPTSGQIEISTTTGSLSDMAVAVYSGNGGIPCNNLSLINCNDNGIGMPDFVQTGLIAGNTYYIRVWDEGGNQTGTFNIALTDPSQLYCLRGNAQQFTPSGHVAADNCIRLTQNTNNQVGCAWSNSPFDLNSDFDVSFSVNLGSSDAGADGMAFVIQNSGSGPFSSCGSSGGGVGAEGITPSVIIEFDTWQNGGGEPENLPLEPTYDHIALETDGTLIHDGFGNSAPTCGPVQASSTNVNIEDGIEHTVRITWNSSTQTISVYFDGVLRFNCNVDMVSLLGTATPNWGFTASTGGATNEQYFCPGTLPLSVDFYNFYVECVGDYQKLNWFTSTQNETVNFIIENSFDGVNFYTLEEIERNGHSSFHSYKTNGKQIGKYFRIKNVDDNEVSYSKVVFNSCGNNNEISVFPNPTQSMVFFENINEKTNLSITNSVGYKIKDNIEIDENTKEIDISEFPKGVYYFQFSTLNNNNYVNKIIKL